MIPISRRRKIAADASIDEWEQRYGELRIYG